MAPGFLAITLWGASASPAIAQGDRARRTGGEALGTFQNGDDTIVAPPASIALERLEWTANPGAFEQELRRRVANPLYPVDRQIVLPAELRAAKIRDASEARVVLSDMVDLSLDRGTLARAESIDEMRSAMDRYAELIGRAMGIGGEAISLADSLRRSRTQLLAEWRERNADAPEILAGIDRLEAGQGGPASRDPFVAQLLREDGPIPPDEIVSALLSESPATIQRALAALDRARRDRVRRSGIALLERLDGLGVELDGAEAKLAVLRTAGA